MRLLYHGGGCCGIKTIVGFYGSLSGPVSAKSEDSREQYQKDRQKWGLSTTPVDDFYWPAAPTETYKERFFRYVEHCKAQSPGGLIEVILETRQAARWGNTLSEAGFKEVLRFYNGNSGNTLVLYHLVHRNHKVLE